MKEIKTIGKQFVRFSLDFLAEGPTVAKVDLQNLVQLSQNQYYRVEDWQLRCNAITVNTLTDGVLNRSTSLIQIGGEDLSRYIDDNDYIISYANHIYQSYGMYSGAVVINGTSAVVSSTDDFIVPKLPLSFKELDAVVSGDKITFSVMRGDILTASFGGLLQYSVVALDDSERIEVLQRCRC